MKRPLPNGCKSFIKKRLVFFKTFNRCKYSSQKFILFVNKEKKILILI
jgi:hypothetical protein